MVNIVSKLLLGISQVQSDVVGPKMCEFTSSEGRRVRMRVKPCHTPGKNSAGDVQNFSRMLGAYSPLRQLLRYPSQN